MATLILPTDVSWSEGAVPVAAAPRAVPAPPSEDVIVAVARAATDSIATCPPSSGWPTAAAAAVGQPLDGGHVAIESVAARATATITSSDGGAGTARGAAATGTAPSLHDTSVGRIRVATWPGGPCWSGGWT